MTSDLRDIYQEVILDHNRRPRNRRTIDAADRRAQGHNPLCGDHVTVFMKLKDDVVIDVSFEGSGCAIATASASLMTETVKGKTLDEVKVLFRKFHGLVTGGVEETDSGLGKLAVFSGVCRYPVRVKCATLVWHAVNSALATGGGTISTE